MIQFKRYSVIFLASSTKWFFDFVVFKDKVKCWPHSSKWDCLLYNECDQLISMLLTPPNSLLDFINFYIYLSLQKAFLLMPRRVCELSDPHFTIWRPVAQQSDRVTCSPSLVCGLVWGLVTSGLLICAVAGSWNP